MIFGVVSILVSLANFSICIWIRYLSIYLSIYISIYPSICLSIYQYSLTKHIMMIFGVVSILVSLANFSICIWIRYISIYLFNSIYLSILINKVCFILNEPTDDLFSREGTLYNALYLSINVTCLIK